jgi:hypothetical protein
MLLTKYDNRPIISNIYKTDTSTMIWLLKSKSKCREKPLIHPLDSLGCKQTRRHNANETLFEMWGGEGGNRVPLG